MSIREAMESDSTQLATLVRSLAHLYLEDPDGRLPDWFACTLTPTAFRERMASHEFRNFVFEESGRVVGYISIKGESHLYHLFVSESSQGKGIARQLWQYVSSTSNVWSLRSSINAIPVYVKFGFRKVGEPGCKDGIWFQPMALQKSCYVPGTADLDVRQHSGRESHDL